MDFLIASAMAAEAGAAGAPPYFDFLLIFGMIAIFYFLLWRPQAKRAKEQRALLSSLAKGDEIVTSGGIVGVISRVDDDFVTARVAQNVEMRFQKHAISATLPKGTLKSLDER